MDDDERQVELDCIAAIFPEIVLDPATPFSASIELPVHPANAVKVLFPASADGATTLPTPPRSESSGDIGQVVEGQVIVESHDLSYLPSLQLEILLPEGYPSECAPRFTLSTSPDWLSKSELKALEQTGEAIWEEGGRTETVYGYIDSLQQAAENAFGYGDGKVLEVPQDYKIALLDFDIKATQAAFERETFDCGICLDPKKGSVCHKMIDCGHVFCIQCLQDFYNNAINEGDLISVRCLTPDCAKKREEARGSKRKAKTQISPSELLQIPLEHEIVTRYVKLKHKAELESDKNTIYCPRTWCQGAARSKKHRKPEGFEVVDSDDESEAESNGSEKKFEAGKDLLSVCEDCGFAFCSRCYQGWHGEFTLCVPKQTSGELTEEDKASLEYLKLHTTPCPTCAAPAQKTHGCNHMICFKCNSHFCYLCSAWLEPSNPYKHYNDERTGCYMRLWELEGGDGDDVGIGYGGGDRHAAAPDVEEMLVEEDSDEEDLGGPHPIGNAWGEEPAQVQADIPRDGHQPAPMPNGAAAPPLQREGPLVLRINEVPRAVPAPAAVPAPNPQHARRNGRFRRVNPNQRVNVPAGRPQQQARGAAHDARPAPAPARPEAAVGQVDAAQQAWVQRFVQMALNDEEDQLEWDSDDEEDAEAWIIPVR